MGTSDYCKKYFPKCGGAGLYGQAFKEACSKLRGRINECGCCICNSIPDTDGATRQCAACQNEESRCRQKPGAVRCQTGDCGRGALCKGTAADCSGERQSCDGDCKEGCKCYTRIRPCAICPRGGKWELDCANDIPNCCCGMYQQ